MYGSNLISSRASERKLRQRRFDCSQSEDRSSARGSEGEDEELEMRMKRKFVKDARIKRKRMDRAATAHQYGERRQQMRLNTNPDDAILAEMHKDSKMKRADSKLDILYDRLKACQGDNGFVDPAKILQTMNMV